MNTDKKTVTTGIMRCDDAQRQMFGYMVRISRQCKAIQEFYSDKRCGGPEQSLVAAKQRYEELVNELPQRTSTKNLKTKRNKSGKVGVHLSHQIDKRWPDCEYWFYVASWRSKNGKHIHRSFSINKYGEDEAWNLACLARDNEILDRKEVIAIYENSKLAIDDKAGLAQQVNAPEHMA